MRGFKVPLKEIATIKKVTGPAFIYRDNNKRFIGVKFSVRERDLGSTIAEAQIKVKKNVKLPKGYTISWTGEFENQVAIAKITFEEIATLYLKPYCVFVLFPEEFNLQVLFDRFKKKSTTICFYKIVPCVTTNFIVLLRKQNSCQI